jgi:hypothetical protein
MNKFASIKQYQENNEDIKCKMPPSLSDMLNDSHLYLHPKNEKCVFNEYGQCIKGFRYFCAYCNCGLNGIYSSCHNKKCDIPKFDSLTTCHFVSDK